MAATFFNRPPPPAIARAAAARVAFLPADARLEPAPGEALLGAIAFGTPLPPGLPRGLPAAAVPLDAVGGGPALEVWFGEGPVDYGDAHGLAYARGPEFLFGTLRAPADRLERSSFEAYLRVVRLAREQGYPALVRMWNYFPDINVPCDGLERYRHFCVGRYQALAETGYAFGADLPAASAIGTAGGDLHIAFLAARTAPRQIENPRQLSAYLYPRSYGPRSPSFSRAMLHTGSSGACLFISGTAAIVRHSSVHPGDSLRQCETTLDNLRAILDRAGGPDTARLGADAAWKVYLRHPDEVEPVRALLRKSLAPDSPVLFVSGDICRADLRLEIEGWVRLRKDASTIHR